MLSLFTGIPRPVFYAVVGAVAIGGVWGWSERKASVRASEAVRDFVTRAQVQAAEDAGADQAALDAIEERNRNATDDELFDALVNSGGLRE